MRERTTQENFWSENFGDCYTKRNGDVQQSLPPCIAKWARRLKCMSPMPTSALELGCNIGLNIMALNALQPNMKIEAIEINSSASKEAEKTGAVIYNTSIFEFNLTRTYELSFTCGVLIHIDPMFLSKAYDLLYHSSSRYILISEYYNPYPVEVEYRGYRNKLFKRDFAGDLMDRYPDLCLCDYGFFYRRDQLARADDSTWFVLEKRRVGG